MDLPVLATLVEGVLGAQRLNAGTQRSDVRVRQQYGSDNGLIAYMDAQESTGEEETMEFRV